MNATYGALSTSLMGSMVKPNIWEQPTEDFTSSSLHEGGKMAVGCVMDTPNRFIRVVFEKVDPRYHFTATRESLKVGSGHLHLTNSTGDPCAHWNLKFSGLVCKKIFWGRRD